MLLWYVRSTSLPGSFDTHDKQTAILLDAVLAKHVAHVSTIQRRLILAVIFGVEQMGLNFNFIGNPLADVIYFGDLGPPTTSRRRWPLCLQQCSASTRAQRSCSAVKNVSFSLPRSDTPCQLIIGQAPASLIFLRPQRPVAGEATPP